MAWYQSGRWDRSAVEGAVLGVQMPWSPAGPQGPLDPPATEGWIVKFEETHDVRLPSEYRCFLAQVTGGSVLWLPGFDRSDVEPSFGFWHDFDRRSDFYRRPFQFTDVTQVESIESELPFSGTWMLADGGCAMGSMLVVSGECAGEVWDFDNGALSPSTDPAGRRDHFGSWVQREFEKTVAASVRE